jgi:integrase/recombinase XerC/integrase/recombinase XerD
MIYLRWDEALKVEAAAKTLRDRIVIRLPFRVGMRAHEVADSRVEHVDPVGELIFIPHGHRSGARFSCVDRGTLQLLAVYVGSRKKGPLFFTRRGSQLDRRDVYEICRNAGELAGITKHTPVNPLMLKHTFATTWLQRKGNIRLLQKQLGHMKLESTAHYLDWLPEEVKAEYDTIFNDPEETTHLITA